MVDAVVVIDCGSEQVKAGLAGQDAPQVVFPSQVGRRRAPGTSDGVVVVGEQARAMAAGTGQVSQPLLDGKVVHWDDYIKLYRHALLPWPDAAASGGVLMVQHRDRISEQGRCRIVVARQQGAARVAVVDAAVAAAAAVGRTTALVVDIGAAGTRVSAVHRGRPVGPVARSAIGGRDITNHLLHRLTQRGYTFTGRAERGLVQVIKERLCFVALDYDDARKRAEDTSAIEETCELPDGRVASVGVERFACPDRLFRPEDWGLEVPGLPAMVQQVVDAADSGIRADLFAGVVLTGGTALLPGLSERLAKELRALSRGAPVEVVTPTEPGHRAWSGASILAAAGAVPWDL